MDKSVEEIIASGVIEEYLFGTLTAQEHKEVEALINNHPDLQQHMQAVQEVLWGMADDMAIEPPPSIKAKIMADIKSEASQQQSSVTANKRLGWWVAAAIALISLPTLIYTNSESQKQINTVKADLRDCAAGQTQVEGKLLALRQLLGEESTVTVLRNPGQQVDVVAFANTSSKQLFLDTRSLPDVPRGKCLQLWGDQDGAMINIGVIDPDRDYLEEPLIYNPAYTSINLTVEALGPDGVGSDHATVENLVASGML